MREIVLTPRFKRSFRRFTRRNPALREHIEDVLRKLQDDAFGSELRTHKLSGQLRGLYACSCGYDCRIVFSLEKQEGEEEEKEVILLIDIGTHDEVY